MKHVLAPLNALAILIALAIVAPLAQADDAAADKAWASEVEVGAVVTTGNTKQQNFKVAARATLDSELFKHTASFDALRSSEDGTVTAEKYYTYYQGDYKLEGDHSLFGRISYEDDRFSGYDYQTDATVGYSRSLINRENHQLRGDVGIGLRHSVPDMGDSTNEFITRLAANYDWRISETAKFHQLLSVEIGDKNTITRSESALQSKVNGNLAMKFSVNIKHQSDVPVGNEKTDTETALTLVYSF
ncbi:MAG: DUF481 domain-containing protein [Pseudomonadales bacterium]|nr:DUF481 domain-containing protein [Pseudomonadales bacterium]